MARAGSALAGFVCIGLMIVTQLRLCNALDDISDAFASPSVHLDAGMASDQMQVLDEDARIFLFPALLTPDECDHIIALAEPRLQRSEIVAVDEAGCATATSSDVRTSSGMFLQRGQDEVVRAIEERIARWTLLPVGNGEDMQVLRYNQDQKYDAHWDYFFDKDNTANGGNRVATVLTYLNNVEEGGETVFPLIPAPGGENPADYSQCARKHLAVKPRKGSAVLFFSMTPSGALNQRSMHTACPVAGSSVKYSMAKWIRVGHFSTAADIMAQAVSFERTAEAKQQRKAELRLALDDAITQARLGELLQRMAVQ